MTPTEEAAKLARKRANLEAQFNRIFPKIVHPDYMVASESVREINVLRAQLLVVYRAMLAERDEELKRLREAAEEARRTLDDDVIGGAYTFQEHNCRCKYESALYRARNEGKHGHDAWEAAEAAGCDCGLKEEHNRCVAALNLLKAALQPKEPNNESR